MMKAARKALHPLCSPRAYSQLLELLIDWEQRGIPKAAGTSASKEFNLGRMHRLLHVLGDPHLAWPAVHVAGSKGKGSTASMIAAMLRSAGFKVGIYTSPHMHHISERISTVPGSHIHAEAFSALVEEHARGISEVTELEGGELSHFEAVTALAFRHFADQKVDIAVIETGMGGLMDATNVIAAAQLQLAVITALGMEHVEALGGSLLSIAAAKAGIIKAGRPVIISPQRHGEAEQVVLQRAAAMGSEALRAGEMVQVRHDGYSIGSSEASASAVREVVSVSGPSGMSLTATTALIGPHQHANIATAVAAVCKLRATGWGITDAAIVAGLEGAYLPGRFQVLELGASSSVPGPGADGGCSSNGRYLVLDGAHTPESAAALVTTLSAVFPGRPVVLVVAMASDKQHRAVIDELRHCSPKAVIFTSVLIAGSSGRSCAPGVLAGHWQASSMALRVPGRCRQLIQASLSAAIDKAKHELSAHGQGGVICVTGSLHAVAQAERLLREQS